MVRLYHIESNGFLHSDDLAADDNKEAFTNSWLLSLAQRAPPHKARPLSQRGRQNPPFGHE